MDGKQITSVAVLALLDRAAEITNTMTFDVPGDAFGVWLEALGEKTFAVNLYGDEGDRVHAHSHGYHNSTYVQLHTIVDGVDGHEVPGRDTETQFLILPASEATKLRSGTRA